MPLTGNVVLGSSYSYDVQIKEAVMELPERVEL